MSTRVRGIASTSTLLHYKYVLRAGSSNHSSRAQFVLSIKDFLNISRERNMSCCGGNCGCGSSCKCGSGCGGCKMYPDFSFSGESTSETLIAGVAPQNGHIEGFEASAGSENGGCKCGSSCTCDPCTCK